MGTRPDAAAAPRPAPADLRMPLLGVMAWLGGVAATYAPGTWFAAALAVFGAVLVGVWWRRGSSAALRTAVGGLLVFAAVGTAAQLRAERADRNPVAALGRAGAFVDVRLAVTADPRPVEGRFGDQVLVQARIRSVTGRGHRWRVRAPVLVIGGRGWAGVRLGGVVSASGLLAPADDDDLAAVLRARGDPAVVAEPDVWWRAAEAVRASLRGSVANRPDDQRALVPALVVGDDARLDDGLADDFRVTGLTHLLAVSGTNLTLLVGFLLVVARWLGVRGRGLVAVGGVGIVGFVLLARAEPSVVRAAAMGTVALVGMGRDGTHRAGRGLGVAVVVLLLLDPRLATSAGFALSVGATAGIVFLAPRWRDALAGWLPRWLAEAVAVPAAAQLACTPLVAALSAQVSLVAVAANLAVAPVVGPATVLGLAGGLVGLAWPWLSRAVGTLAGWTVSWIVLVAERGAALPTPAVDWGAGPVPIAGLTLICAGVALVASSVLRHRLTGLGCGLLLALTVLVRPPIPGWPPRGWTMVACDVGQGDALVLNAGHGAGVVVDAGPDPRTVDACLDRLGVTTVPLLVLTHFHADHIDGLAGVTRGRAVHEIAVTWLAEPADAAKDVAAAAARLGLVPRVPTYGETTRVGDVTLQVVAPQRGDPWTGSDQGSGPNNASVVLIAQVRGVRILLAGDVEPEAQAALQRRLSGLGVDVLKVPHHGSRHQDLDFLRGLGARIALVSVGADNDYGHPARELLASLARAGARVLRTDQDGDLAVIERDGRLSTLVRAQGASER